MTATKAVTIGSYASAQRRGLAVPPMPIPLARRRSRPRQAPATATTTLCTTNAMKAWRSQGGMPRPSSTRRIQSQLMRSKALL
eukprot:15430928-Alexandrium_andersonii.AAC.1